MFKKSDWISHEDYLATVWREERERQRLTGESLFRGTLELTLLRQMTYLNLDRVLPLVAQLYSEDMGRPASPQRVIRSLFLFVASKGRTGAGFSLDNWVTEAKCKKELYVLMGCSSPEEVPSVSAHYDFLDKIWAGDRTEYKRGFPFDAMANHRKEKMKVGEDNKVIETVYKVEEMAKNYGAGVPLSRNDERGAQQFVTFLGVYPSIENGCIPKVICAGIDSSALPEHASRYGKTACGIKRRFCEFRHVCGTSATSSCLSGSIGKDCGEDNMYFGEGVNVLVCPNPKLHIDLPLSFTFTDAIRHDSITFFVTLQEFHRNALGVLLDYLLADKAYGYVPLARAMLEEGTIPLFDVPKNQMSLSSLPKGVVLNKAEPCCCEGTIPMVLFQNDEENQHWSYGCPLEHGRKVSCPNADNCPLRHTPVIIDPKKNPNIFTVIPREHWKYVEAYKLRSGNERVNDRLFNDYHLADFKTRNVCHRSFLAAVGCILIHQDAWYKASIVPEGENARKLFEMAEKGLRKLTKKPIQKCPRPKPGRKVDTERFMQEILNRNAQERAEDACRFDKVHRFYEAYKKELEKGPVWTCPYEKLKEQEARGETPSLDTPREISIPMKIEIDWYERFFVKRWEKTILPYVPPGVVLDPKRCIEVSSPDVLTVTVEIGGKTVTFVEFDWEGKKKPEEKPPVINGFQRVDEGVWVRPAQAFTEVREKPREETIHGFAEYERTLESFQSENYISPVIAGIGWEDSDRNHTKNEDVCAQGTREPTGDKPGTRASPGEGSPTTPVRNESYRLHPIPRREALEKLKRYWHSLYAGFWRGRVTCRSVVTS